jgi:hypothetical protein
MVIFSNILSLMFWFHSAYFRIIIFCFVVPIFELIEYKLSSSANLA